MKEEELESNRNIESLDINQLLKIIKKSNHKEEYLKSQISKENAEIILKKLSQGEIEINSKCSLKIEESSYKDENEDISINDYNKNIFTNFSTIFTPMFPPIFNTQNLINSKKPLWIDDVKRTCQRFIPSIDIKDLENTKDILLIEEREDMLISMEEYPYYQTIKKLQYAFGDIYKNSQRTTVYLHDFLKKFLIILAKILNECEFKKILEHLYSYEFNKFYNYKKLKFKNNLDKEEENVINENLLEEEDLGGVLEEVENLENEIIVSETVVNNINNDNFIVNNNKYNLNYNLNLQNEQNGQSGLNEPNENNELNTNEKKNYLESIFEDKDEYYFENLQFQDLRTSHMTHTEYLEFIQCRHQTFLTKGKKTFLNFLQTILQNNFTHDLKDLNNLELLSFLLKEIFKKIITQSIRNKHPDNLNKLFILNHPILIEDLEDLCNFEIEKLESFLNDFHTDNYLMREFKKKKSCKDYNKNVKIKRKMGEFVLVIKKIVFLQDDGQIEFLRKNKKNSEEKVFVILKNLMNKYLELIKVLKIKLESLEQDNISTYKNKKSTRKKIKNKISSIMNNGEVEFNLKNKFSLINLISSIDELDIKNYYEYYLIKFFLIENLESKLDFTNLNEKNEYKFLIDEINQKINLIKKTNKKHVVAKFKNWLKMENNERNFIIDEFNKITKIENNFYQNEGEDLEVDEDDDLDIDYDVIISKN